MTNRTLLKIQGGSKYYAIRQKSDDPHSSFCHSSLTTTARPPALRYNRCEAKGAARHRHQDSPTAKVGMKGKSKRKVAHIPDSQTAIDLSAEPRKWFRHWHHLDLT